MDEGMEEARRALEEAKALQGRTALLAVQVRTALECLRRATDYYTKETTMARSDWYDAEKAKQYHQALDANRKARPTSGDLIGSVLGDLDLAEELRAQGIKNFADQQSDAID